MDMRSILKHELSCVPLSLADTDGTIKSNSKSALLGILLTGIEIATAVSSPYVSNAMVGACTNSKSGVVKSYLRHCIVAKT